MNDCWFDCGHLQDVEITVSVVIGQIAQTGFVQQTFEEAKNIFLKIPTQINSTYFIHKNHNTETEYFEYNIQDFQYIQLDFKKIDQFLIIYVN